MTVPLTADSPRRAAAMRYGSLLASTMRKRGVGNKTLGAQVGVAPSAVASWRAGNNLPRLETAIRVATALGNDTLASIVREGREAPCENCRRMFVNEGGGPKRYCSTACLKLANVKRSGTPTRERAVVAERRLTMHMAAVDAFCRGCEPEGLCRDSECSLRPVSPLPMAQQQAPTVLQVVPAVGPTHDAAWLASVRRGNAERWSREGEKARFVERVAVRTPEQREARNAAISAGRRRAG